MIGQGRIVFSLRRDVFGFEDALPCNAARQVPAFLCLIAVHRCLPLVPPLETNAEAVLITTMLEHDMMTETAKRALTVSIFASITFPASSIWSRSCLLCFMSTAKPVSHNFTRLGQNWGASDIRTTLPPMPLCATKSRSSPNVWSTRWYK